MARMNLDMAMGNKVLERAAELVERGWCTGAFGTANGVSVGLEGLEAADALCAVGAISLVITEVLGLQRATPVPTNRRLSPDWYMTPEFAAARRAIIRQLHAKFPSLYDLVRWNDFHGRTGDEVAALFRAAVKKEGVAL